MQQPATLKMYFQLQSATIYLKGWVQKCVKNTLYVQGLYQKKQQTDTKSL